MDFLTLISIVGAFHLLIVVFTIIEGRMERRRLRLTTQYTLETASLNTQHLQVKASSHDDVTPVCENEEALTPLHSSSNKSAFDKPAGDKPTDDKRANDKHANDKHANDKRGNDKRANDKRAGEKPSDDKPAGNKSVINGDENSSEVIPHCLRGQDVHEFNKIRKHRKNAIEVSEVKEEKS